MRLNLTRRLQGLEGNRSPRPTALEERKAAALSRMTDEELALLSNVVTRNPQKAESGEEEAALRHFAAEFASAQQARSSRGLC